MNRKSLTHTLLSGVLILLFNSVFYAHSHSFKGGSKHATPWLNTNDFSDGLWLYVPSTGALPRYIADLNPFFQGREKIVRLNWTQFGLKIVEEDRDRTNIEQPARWQQGSPVLTIPVEYLQHNLFKPSPEKMLVHEYNETSWFEHADLEEQGAAEVVQFEMDPKNNSIQIELKRTYRVKESAAEDYYHGSLSDLTFSVSFYYSLVKLDEIASPDYQPIRYAPYEKSRFGFFDTLHKKPDQSYRYTQGTSVRYLNRFNPNKTQLDYYLSDSFFKPENEVYRQTTLDTFADINNVLKQTGVPPFNIVNPDSPKQISPGDLRYNIINLIDEPLHNGLLGYGPSVTNPLTGEIVKGQVNQYAGTISRIVPRIWNDLVRLYNRRHFDVYTNVPSFSERRGQWVTSNVEELLNIDAMDWEPSSPPVDDTANHQLWGHVRLSELDTQLKSPKIKQPNAQETLLTPTPLNKIAKQNEQRLDHWSTNNAFAQEFVWVSSTAKAKIKGVDYDHAALYEDDEKRTLKKWHKLDATTKTQVHYALTAQIYRSTLVHELGHDLGLRHNFKGSSDKHNFYSPQEAQDLGYTHPPASSSVMDYAASDFDALVNFGPYDIAALRYAYKRDVVYFPKEKEQRFTFNLSKMDTAYLQNDPNLEFGPLYTLDTLLNSTDSSTLPLSRHDLKKYFTPQELAYLEQQTLSRNEFAYCTDEHIRTHSGCNRFIEGSNVYETMLFREQKYLDQYERLFTREDKEHFNLNAVLHNAQTQFMLFAQMRDVIEDYALVDAASNEMVGGIFEPGQAIESLYGFICMFAGNDHSICALRDATHEVGHFFVDILARPDKICEIEQLGRVQQVPLTELYQQMQENVRGPTKFPKTCFDPWLERELNAQDTYVRSETRDGWPLDSVAANNPNYPYAGDIDVAGAWIDKLLVMQFLAARGSVFEEDKTNGLALLDLPSIKHRFQRVLETLALGKSYPQDIVFVDKDGRQVEPQTPHRWDPQRQLAKIPAHLGVIKHHFDLQPVGRPLFIKELLKQLEYFSFTRHPDMQDQAQTIINLTRAGESLSPERAFYLGNKEYSIGPDNFLAWEMSKHLVINDEELLTILNDLPHEHRQQVNEQAEKLLSLLKPNPLHIKDSLARLYIAGACTPRVIDHWLALNQAGHTFASALRTLSKTGEHYTDQTTTHTQMQLEQLWLLINKLHLAYNDDAEQLKGNLDTLKALSVLIRQQRETFNQPLLKRLWNNRYLATTIAALHDLEFPNHPDSWLEKMNQRFTLLPSS